MNLDEYNVESLKETKRSNNLNILLIIISSFISLVGIVAAIYFSNQSLEKTIRNNDYQSIIALSQYEPSLFLDITPSSEFKNDFKFSAKNMGNSEALNLTFIIKINFVGHDSSSFVTSPFFLPELKVGDIIESPNFTTVVNNEDPKFYKNFLTTLCMSDSMEVLPSKWNDEFMAYCTPSGNKAEMIIYSIYSNLIGSNYIQKNRFIVSPVFSKEKDKKEIEDILIEFDRRSRRRIDDDKEFKNEVITLFEYNKTH